MKISRNPEKYFSEDQYLLADSAYASGKYVVPCFRGPALQNPQNSDFNYYLAQSRVQIEHAIGIVKGHFSSLQEMRCQFKGEKDAMDVNNWIIACLILHNLLANLKDQWNELYEEDDPEPAPTLIQEESTHTTGGMRARIIPITLAHFSE